MVSNLLPPSRTLRPRPDDRPGDSFGRPLASPRQFTGAGHGGENGIPLDTLTRQVVNNQEFEGFEGLHSPRELEADLAAEGVSIVRKGVDPLEGTAPLGALMHPRRRGA